MRLGSSRSEAWQLLVLIAAIAVVMATWRAQLQRSQPAYLAIGQLSSSDADIRLEAVHKLGRMGSSQVELVMEALLGSLAGDPNRRSARRPPRNCATRSTTITRPEDPIRPPPFGRR